MGSRQTPNSAALEEPASGQRAVTIWSVSLDDRSRRRIVDAAIPASFAAISPDGREMVYAKVAGGAANVWKVPVAGGQPVQLTFESAPVTFPLWSPDGKWLAANLARSPGRHVGVFPAGGGAVAELTTGPGFDLPVAGSPDCAKVVFAGQHNGVWNLYLVSRNGGDIRQLTGFTLPGGWVRTAARSPRDDQIVFEQMDRKGGIFLAELAPPAR
jgi:TolB protein